MSLLSIESIITVYSLSLINGEDCFRNAKKKKKESSTNHKVNLEKLKGNTLVCVWVSWQNAVFSYENKSEQQLLTMLLLGTN